jgi:hypothetical protein
MSKRLGNTAGPDRVDSRNDACNLPKDRRKLSVQYLLRSRVDDVKVREREVSSLRNLGLIKARACVKKRRLED